MKRKLALGLVAALMMGAMVGCSKPADVESGSFTDGITEGIAKGYGGDIKVSVEVEDGKIAKIDILDMSETPGIGDDGAEKTIKAIIDAQSTDVDTVSGATVSSKATIEAVEVALGLKEAAVVEEEEVEVEAETFVDGTYVGEAKGFGGVVKVKVVVEGTKITAIEALEHAESAGMSDPAFDKVPAAMMELQTTEVDIASGATITSDALINAVKNALASEPVGEEVAEEPVKEEPKKEEPKKEEPKKEEPKKEEPKTTEGVGKGFGGDIKVKVVRNDGKITSVEVLTHSETPGISDPAIKQIPAAIVAANSADVDAVTNATMTSNGIKEAVKAALAK